MSMVPYGTFFPELPLAVPTLYLERNTGGIPKGKYRFFDLYCNEKGCDCRRVMLMVANDKDKQVACISMGFDLNAEMAGPYLDILNKQSEYAEELMEAFVSLINDDADTIETYQQHYCEVRTKVEGKKYKGKPFPKFGSYKRSATTESAISAKSSKNASRSGDNIKSLAERQLKQLTRTNSYKNRKLEDDLRRYILSHDTFAIEIAELLVGLCDTADNDNRLESAIQLLATTLEILRVEMERGRAGSVQKMERLQSTLAQKIYVECGDDLLCPSVSNVFMQSRVELLPVLNSANSQRLMLNSHRSGGSDILPENALNEMFNEIEEMAGDSPFEALTCLMQFLGMGDTDLQEAFSKEMMGAKKNIVRDTGALMILHPSPEIRVAVSRLLADDPSNITPQTLTRLVIIRNWFDAKICKNIDKAVTKARKARIECAPLPKPLKGTLYSSVVDGAFAQGFHTIVPDGKGYVSYGVLVKKGVGVADAFVIPLRGKKDLNEFVNILKQEGAFLESSPEYFDQRICHALAEGASLGNAPNFWLAKVAEMLGKDQWKGIPFDGAKERGRMRAELEQNFPKLLSDKECTKALEDSMYWHDKFRFIDSWFEDDAEVDSVIESALKKVPDEAFAVDAIFDYIIDKRRDIWLERITLNALWLKSCLKSPLQWHQMFHIAEAVADEHIDLADIPLMENVAIRSLIAYKDRKSDDIYSST
jgi:hypothetical protein